MMNRHSIIWVKKVETTTLSLKKIIAACSKSRNGWAGIALRSRERWSWGLPDEGYNEIRPLIIFKRCVLINLNAQFSLLHFLGVFLVCMQRFRLIGFMVLELWRRHTHTLLFAETDATLDSAYQKETKNPASMKELSFSFNLLLKLLRWVGDTWAVLTYRVGRGVTCQEINKK